VNFLNQESLITAAGACRLCHAWPSVRRNCRASLTDDDIDTFGPCCMYVAIAQCRPHKMTPLMLAAEAGNLDVVDLLLNFEDVDIDLKDDNGQTARDIAKMRGFPAIVELIESV